MSNYKKEDGKENCDYCHKKLSSETITLCCGHTICSKITCKSIVNSSPYCPLEECSKVQVFHKKFQSINSNEVIVLEISKGTKMGPAVFKKLKPFFGRSIKKIWDTYGNPCHYDNFKDELVEDFFFEIYSSDPMEIYDFAN